MLAMAVSPHRSVICPLARVTDGTSDSPAARDEYESYVPRVFQSLKSTTYGSEVADYLHWLATEHMGVGAGRERDVEIVALLLRWRDQLVE